MAIFKSSSLRFLRFYSLGVGIVGLLCFALLFFGYFFIAVHMPMGRDRSLWNLHCVFMEIVAFMQVCANILLIVGSIKQSHQEVRVWLILNLISFIIMSASALTLYKDFFGLVYIDTRYVPIVIIIVIIYLISCDIVYSYYFVRRQFAYGYVEG